MAFQGWRTLFPIQGCFWSSSKEGEILFCTHDPGCHKHPGYLYLSCIIPLISSKSNLKFCRLWSTSTSGQDPVVFSFTFWDESLTPSGTELQSTFQQASRSSEECLCILHYLHKWLWLKTAANHTSDVSSIQPSDIHCALCSSIAQSSQDTIIWQPYTNLFVQDPCLMTCQLYNVYSTIVYISTFVQSPNFLILE